MAEEVNIRTSFVGLGRVIAFRAIEAVEWPTRIDPKYRPAVFGECVYFCTTWVLKYFTEKEIFRGLVDVPPAGSLARLARIDPVWFGKFSERVEKLLVKTPISSVAWRYILSNEEDKGSKLKTNDNPIVSREIKKFYGLLKTEFRQVGGQRIEVDKTDEAAILNMIKSGRKRVEAEEKALDQFCRKIDYPGGVERYTVTRKFQNALEQSDHLVDREYFIPTGIPAAQLLTRHELRFWDWLCASKNSSDIYAGLRHLSRVELESIAYEAVRGSRAKAIIELAENFDLARFWQTQLFFCVNRGDVVTVYGLIQAGAKITEEVQRTAQHRMNPHILGILGIPWI